MAFITTTVFEVVSTTDNRAFIISRHHLPSQIEIGNTLSLDCRRSYLRAGDRAVVVIGVDDLIVVDTPDVVLVVPKDQAQRVKEVVEMLDEQGRSDLLSTMSLSDFSTRK